MASPAGLLTQEMTGSPGLPGALVYPLLPSWHLSDVPRVLQTQEVQPELSCHAEPAPPFMPWLPESSRATLQHSGWKPDLQGDASFSFIPARQAVSWNHQSIFMGLMNEIASYASSRWVCPCHWVLTSGSSFSPEEWQWSLRKL